MKSRQTFGGCGEGNDTGGFVLRGAAPEEVAICRHDPTCESYVVHVAHRSNVADNPLLSSDEWRKSNNERERERLEDAGYDRVAEPRESTAKNAGAYVEVERETAIVAEEYPELSLVERTRLARERVEERARQGIVAKTEAEKAHNYLGGTVDELIVHDTRVHAGGGAGNAEKWVTERYCAKCYRLYKRRVMTFASGKKSFTHYTPHDKCECDAPYIERRETVQLMGAKSSGGSGGSESKTRAKPVKTSDIAHRAQKKYDWLLREDEPAKPLSDEERARKGIEESARWLGVNNRGLARPRSFKYPPMFRLFMRQSGTLKVADILRFFMLTEEYAMGDIAVWLSELSELEAQDRERLPGESGRPKKFGVVEGLDGTERLPNDLCATLTQKWDLLTEGDAGAGFERYSMTLERGAGITLTHVVVLAIATYIWYLVELSDKLDEALLKRDLPPNPRRCADALNFRSSVAECELLSQIIARHDDPAVKRLREGAARMIWRARDILAPFLFEPVSKV